MRIKPDEFYRMTMREYLASVDGYLMGYYKELEQTRLICYFIVNTYAKKPLGKPSEIFELPTDSDEGMMTLEEQRRIMEYWKNQTPN